MSFQWPVDKITLINRALAVTGNNLITALEDGSDEYNVCSPAYEDGLACLTEEASYGFSTRVATLAASPTAPADTEWDTAFVLPQDLIHIVWVKINDGGTGADLAHLARWDLLNGQLVINAQGGPPPPSPAVTPATVTMKYASSEGDDPTVGTPLFVRALSLYVMAAIYRGLHNDAAEGAKMFAAAESSAQRARSRYDMQKPKRSLFNSRITAVRRIPAPWPTTGNNSWGGSGNPS